MEVKIDQDYGCWSTGTNDIKSIQLATDIIDFLSMNIVLTQHQEICSKTNFEFVTNQNFDLGTM